AATDDAAGATAHSLSATPTVLACGVWVFGVSVLPPHALRRSATTPRATTIRVQRRLMVPSSLGLVRRAGFSQLIRHSHRADGPPRRGSVAGDRIRPSSPLEDEAGP